MTFEELQEENAQLNEQVAEMEGDIRATVKAISGFMGQLGINIGDLDGGGDIMSQLPSILNKAIMKMGMGTMDSSSFTNLKELSPIMDKYKHLVTDIIDE